MPSIGSTSQSMPGRARRRRCPPRRRCRRRAAARAIALDDQPLGRPVELGDHVGRRRLRVATATTPPRRPAATRSPGLTRDRAPRARAARRATRVERSRTSRGRALRGRAARGPRCSRHSPRARSTSTATIAHADRPRRPRRRTRRARAGRRSRRRTGGRPACSRSARRRAPPTRIATNAATRAAGDGSAESGRSSVGTVPIYERDARASPTGRGDR